jgi:hypothetical protein
MWGIILLHDVPVRSINEETLQALVKDKAREDKFLEFKKSLSVSTREEKEEFLADVSSFANAAGGDLVLGMIATEGVASELRGIKIKDIDAETQRIESIIRDGIDPRIQGIVTQSVQLKSSKYAVVIRIPRSWVAPHMIRLNWNSRFYSRNSNGKYILDVTELKQAFLLSETITERARNFRIERLGRIVSQETPIQLENNPKLILHMIPFRAFDLASRFGMESVDKDQTNFTPISTHTVISRKYNFDGFLRYSHQVSSSVAYSYVQMFRNGIIEAVDADVLSGSSGAGMIGGENCESAVLCAIPRFLTVQKKLGVELPIAIMITLQGVAGLTIGSSASRFGFRQEGPIDRNDLLVPEVLIENYEAKIDEAMKPAFDAIWSASGWPGSPRRNQAG